MASVARTVARQDRYTADVLSRLCPFVERFIALRGGVVTLVQPELFAESFAAARAGALQAALTKRPALPERRPAAAVAAMRRKLALWSKVQPKAILAGVIDRDGSVSRAVEGKAALLHDHWRISHRSVSEQDAAQLAAELPPLPASHPR